MVRMKCVWTLQWVTFVSVTLAMRVMNSIFAVSIRTLRLLNHIECVHALAKCLYLENLKLKPVLYGYLTWRNPIIFFFDPAIILMNRQFISCLKKPNRNNCDLCR